jgi:serine/threonine-protein kinase RsbW
MSTTIKFASKPENITIAEKFIEDVRVEAKIGDSVYEDILIALTEAANNAMSHGNKDNEEKNVEIWCKLDENRELLSLIVRDEGPGFDYDNIPDPTTPENLPRANGRGVFLMKELAQAIFFSNKGARVDMLFSL